MKLLAVSLALCSLLTLSRAVPLNSTLAKHMGICEYVRQNSHNVIGAFIPQCDLHGNFLPQQCSASTGYCWCVDIFTGEEIPNTRRPPGSAPFDCDTDFYCPIGWSHFGKRCFIFIDSPKTWFEAENYCLFEGANLASIHSYEENHFVQDLTRGFNHVFPESWVGGHDAVYPSFWMWSDGYKFKYAKWYRDDDMDMERTEHCLKINYGYGWKWNCAACNETLPFVCAKRI